VTPDPGQARRSEQVHDDPASDEIPYGASRSGRRVIEELLGLLESVRQRSGMHQGPECQLCPICQAIAAIRQLRPEVIEHLTCAASELAAALREAMGTSSPARSPGSHSPSREPAPFEHIDITE
jgi:hypothetical protein